MTKEEKKKNRKWLEENPERIEKNFSINGT